MFPFRGNTDKSLSIVLNIKFSVRGSHIFVYDAPSGSKIFSQNHELFLDGSHRYDNGLVIRLVK